MRRKNTCHIMNTRLWVRLHQILMVPLRYTHSHTYLISLSFTSTLTLKSPGSTYPVIVKSQVVSPACVVPTRLHPPSDFGWHTSWSILILSKYCFVQYFLFFLLCLATMSTLTLASESRCKSALKCCAPPMSSCREKCKTHAHSSRLPPDSSQCQIINALWPVSLPLPYCLSCKEAVQTPARNTIVIKCSGVWKVEWNVLFEDLVYIWRRASFLANGSQRESLFSVKCSSCSKPGRPYPLAHSSWRRRSHSGVMACGFPLPVGRLTAPPGV